MVTCKECKISFDTEKAFHGHLRRHKLKMKGYYEKHYPKRCLQTQRKLEWKNGDDLTSYLSRDFIDKTALNMYFESRENAEAKKDFLLKFIDESYTKHQTLPSQVELASLPLGPNFLIFDHFIDVKKLIVDRQYKTRFNYSFDYSKKLVLPKIDIDKFVINVDTREQNKYRFYSSISGALSEGDYSLAGNLFNNVVIERKNVADFGATVVGGNERFRREMERVRAHGKYVIVLVEFNIHEIHKHKFYGYTTPPFVCHNMRQIARDYSDVCQFVFGVRRDMCVKYVAEFLLYGQKCREIDLQLYVDYQNSQFRNEEFTKQDLLNLYGINPL